MNSTYTLPVSQPTENVVYKTDITYFSVVSIAKIHRYYEGFPKQPFGVL